jgi:hypothetical protein
MNHAAYSYARVVGTGFIPVAGRAPGANYHPIDGAYLPPSDRWFASILISLDIICLHDTMQAHDPLEVQAWKIRKPLAR